MQFRSVGSDKAGKERAVNNLDGYPSGQRELTVNQLAQAFEGPNPSPSNYAAIISPELITEAEELIIAIIIITLTQADGGICTRVALFTMQATSKNIGVAIC